jgi:hypothetical protein
MTILNIPQNINYLGQTVFKFNILKLPTTNFFVQNVTLPSLSLPPAEYPNPLVTIPQPGDHISFDPLQITFIIDEQMQNYKEISNWMIGLGFPETNDQYKELTEQQPGFGLFSDASLVIQDAKHIPILTYTFRDAFPTNISSIDLSTTATDIEYRTCTVTFAYTLFSIED